jgi:hypothetical protein
MEGRLSPDLILHGPSRKMQDRGVSRLQLASLPFAVCGWLRSSF